MEEADRGGSPEARSEAIPLLQLQGIPDSHCCGKDAGCSLRFPVFCFVFNGKAEFDSP